jgi:hypothetical protein
VEIPDKPPRYDMKNIFVALLTASLLSLVACSPEATRARGGGAGGDIGNRDGDVEIHERIDPYHGTPLRGAGR